MTVRQLRELLAQIPEGQQGAQCVVQDEGDDIEVRNVLMRHTPVGTTLRWCADLTGWLPPGTSDALGECQQGVTRADNGVPVLPDGKDAIGGD